MLKIGVLSDTHLHKVTTELRNLMEVVFRDIDILFHVGDMVDLAVYEYLSNWNIKAVRGNMDSPYVVSMLPEKRIEEINNKRIGLIHGWGSPRGIEDRVMAEFNDVDIIIFGHSHVPLISKRDNITLFNPGSFRDTNTAGIIEMGDEVSFRHITL
ncbi:MAG TPA: YfcE family phosphodiesterase [Syntrophorhabdaceae bacterium]|mgnify:FL=1|nr:YfcE family phosphodiesterase [Syntrophorhabdaceae bacterium]HOL04715.1 YfcE family phosphodiesterase [Syntrophorhabdaceae bacterium]HON85268.1 YfcE family phosphodiesterase [Syntrophorhabdaceae bacterium]HPC66149.1 YfcE family phosphodiesterase [Syntrophorhabdaceae bacterium]HPP41143.1 YfcE family phosphodiesterase [Syntrophorhabdaceae bacterium]